MSSDPGFSAISLCEADTYNRFYRIPVQQGPRELCQNRPHQAL
jgi:hypothetical protein